MCFLKRICSDMFLFLVCTCCYPFFCCMLVRNRRVVCFYLIIFSRLLVSFWLCSASYIVFVLLQFCLMWCKHKIYIFRWWMCRLVGSEYFHLTCVTTCQANANHWTLFVAAKKKPVSFSAQLSCWILSSVLMIMSSIC